MDYLLSKSMFCSIAVFLVRQDDPVAQTASTAKSGWA